MFTGVAFFQEASGDVTIATGGVMSTYTSGSIIYQLHTFDTPGTFTFEVTSAPAGKTFSYLIVGGGAGAGYYQSGVNFGGGGGGGKANEGISYSVTVASYQVIVGTGGNPNANTGTGNPSNDSWGGTSSVFSVYSTGGTPGRTNGTDGGGDGRAAGTGRVGLTSSITGTAKGYAGGGQNSAYLATALEVMGGGRGQRVSAEFATVGATATGGGGGAQGYSGAPGAIIGKRGGSGIVIISYVKDN